MSQPVCTENADDGYHAWENQGVYVVEEVLCSCRVCVWCGVEEVKTYGARKAIWRKKHN